MDYFLNPDNAYDRLIKEYTAYGKLIVAYDFDDTVYDYHNRGTSYDDMIEMLRELRPYASYIVFTSCAKEKENWIASYLDEHDIPYDKINEDIITQFGGRKVYYNLLLDDRAGLFEVYSLLKKFLQYVKGESENA